MDPSPQWTVVCRSVERGLGWKISRKELNSSPIGKETEAQTN